MNGFLSSVKKLPFVHPCFLFSVINSPQATWKLPASYYYYHYDDDGDDDDDDDDDDDYYYVYHYDYDCYY